MSSLEIKLVLSKTEIHDKHSNFMGNTKRIYDSVQYFSSMVFINYHRVPGYLKP